MGIMGLTTHHKWLGNRPNHPMIGYMRSMQRSFCIRSQLEGLAKLTTYSPVSEPNGCPEVMLVRKAVSSLPLLHEEEGALQRFFAISTVMIDLMRRQAELSPAGCPKTEQKLERTASLVGFGMPERMIPTENSLPDAIRRGIDWVLQQQ